MRTRIVDAPLEQSETKEMMFFFLINTLPSVITLNLTMLTVYIVIKITIN